MNHPVFVAITGPSASGKTTLARRLASQLGMDDHQIIAEDAYYHDHPRLDEADRAQLNFDHPDAFDHELLVDHLDRLKNGRSVQIPVYDYVRHRRSGESRHLKPDSVVIVEGMLLLHRPRLRDYFHYSVFLDVDLEICFERRLARDVDERGRSQQQVTHQFERTVKPMYEQFIEPSKQYADQIAADTDNYDSLVNELIGIIDQHTQTFSK